MLHQRFAQCRKLAASSGSSGSRGGHYSGGLQRAILGYASVIHYCRIYSTEAKAPYEICVRGYRLEGSFLFKNNFVRAEFLGLGKFSRGQSVERKFFQNKYTKKPVCLKTNGRKTQVRNQGTNQAMQLKKKTFKNQLLIRDSLFKSPLQNNIGKRSLTNVQESRIWGSYHVPNQRRESDTPQRSTED